MKATLRRENRFHSTIPVDSCRPFEETGVRTLPDIFNHTRLKVCARQPDSLFDEALINTDGTRVETAAEKLQGIYVAYHGIWGYHALILAQTVSLANAGEIVSIANRSGNRPSHQGASEEADRAIDLCRRAGFRGIARARYSTLDDPLRTRS